MDLFERLTDEENIDEAMKWMEAIQTEKALEKKKEKIFFNHRGRAIHFWQYAIAASIIITAGILIYIYRFSKNEKKNEVTVTNTTDIQPGSDKAILTLENGKIIILNDDGIDTTINEQIKILRQKGEIIYNSDLTKTELDYHTLSIPRKGKYRLTL